MERSSNSKKIIVIFSPSSRVNTRVAISKYPLYIPLHHHFISIFMASDLSQAFRGFIHSFDFHLYISHDLMRHWTKNRSRWIVTWIKRNTHDLIKLSYVGRPIKSNVLFERWQPDTDSMLIQGIYHGCHPQIYFPQRSATHRVLRLFCVLRTHILRELIFTRQPLWMTKYSYILNYSRQLFVNSLYQLSGYLYFITGAWKFHWKSGLYKLHIGSKLFYDMQQINTV